MNTHEQRYTRFSLVGEMMETVDVVREFPTGRVGDLPAPSAAREPFLTGEGSSRIFPAAHAVNSALSHGDALVPRTESAHEATGFDLSGRRVYVASNSGKTAECVHLIRTLRERRHDGGIVGMAGSADSPVAVESDDAYILTCGPEAAVAATKSVVEQALVYDVLFRGAAGRPLPDLSRLSSDIAATLAGSVPEEITSKIVAAPTVYFAGTTNGVAAELALKANEIVRARSGYLPGTYAVHGIEEVMNPRDVLIWIDPPAAYEQKFADVLEGGVGLSIIAVSTRETRFPTMQVPLAADPQTDAYIQLAAGWNMLVEAGLALDINLDRPERARKVGNEFTDAAGSGDAG